jgi:drug/metabolite transporter (DMT)-like permease
MQVPVEIIMAHQAGQRPGLPQHRVDHGGGVIALQGPDLADAPAGLAHIRHLGLVPVEAPGVPVIGEQGGQLGRRNQLIHPASCRSGDGVGEDNRELKGGLGVRGKMQVDSLLHARLASDSYRYHLLPSGVSMKRSSTSVGLVIAVIAAAAFGASGAFVKPLLEAGWSPAGAVTVRAFIGGFVLAPFAIVAIRGRWSALWRARWRVLAMAFVGVAGTQLAYFAAIQRIPVGTGVLIEYMAPLLLVAFAWARTRRMPKAVVLIGSVVALGGLVLVVSPGAGASSFDALGLAFALTAMVGCAIYYLVAAMPSDGLPAVALAAFGLLIGGAVLGLAGLVGLVPFSVTFDDVRLFGDFVPWWIPLLIVGVVATAIAYATSITASEMLGSRLASFVGLLEVVAATFYAWLLLGERLTIPQLIGGGLILAGIAFVRSERTADDLSIEPGSVVLPGAVPESAWGRASRGRR